MSPALVLVEDGRISGVDGTGAAPPDGTEIVDLGDVTLLPGLVDSHVHLCFDAGADVVTALAAADDTTLLDRMESHALQTLERGVTTIRDLGDRRFLGLALRRRWAEQGTLAPELQVSGPPITRTKGHCWFLGGEADGVEGVRAAVGERAERGCDVVKVMATGGVLTPGYGPHESQYGLAELSALVEEAGRHGLPVAAHAHGPSGIADSVAAGVHTVEHCTFFTAEGLEPDWSVVETMVAKGIFAGINVAHLPDPDMVLPPVIAQRMEAIERLVVRMYETGVRMVCNSDAGIGPPKPHGVLPHGIVQLAAMGISNADALDAATAVAAEACGLGDRKGRVAPGWDADLIAVDGDPLVDIESVLRVRAVYRAGVRVV